MWGRLQFELGGQGRRTKKVTAKLSSKREEQLSK